MQPLPEGCTMGRVMKSHESDTAKAARTCERVWGTNSEATTQQALGIWNQSGKYGGW